MNWGEIKSAVREYTHRSDVSDALMAVFLEIAEQRIYHGELNTPKLRCAAMVKTAVLVNGNRPTGFLEAVKIYPSGSPNLPLHYTTLASMPEQREKYSWDGETLVLSDDQAFPVDMIYHGKFDPLVSDGDSNWLSANAPAIYITAIGVEVGDWMRDPAFAQSQAAKYTSACNSLTSSDKAASMSGSPLVIRRIP